MQVDDQAQQEASTLGEMGPYALKPGQGLLDAGMPADVAPLLAQQERNLDTGKDLLGITEQAHESDLDEAIALAKRGTQWQAKTLDLSWANPVPLEGYQQPSKALLELVARSDVEPTSEQVDDILALDDLEEPLRSSLARFVDAFLALDTATQIAYEDVDVHALETLPSGVEAHGAPAAGMALFDAEPGLGQDALADAGIDLTRVFPTRNQFLDAIQDFKQALEADPVQPASASSSCAPIQVLWVFSIDLDACDNTYNQDFVLQFDAGGSDVYYNNAGGSPLSVDKCDSSSVIGLVKAAALVDFGAGSDTYGDTQNTRECGVNGGASSGVGFLLDDGGNDAYIAGRDGTNGGSGWYPLVEIFGLEVVGTTGVGFLLDAGGDDTYSAGYRGTNGGSDAGVGFLLDAGGDDTYDAGSQGTNGGGHLGVGFLLDAEGDDMYDAHTRGTNGGGHFGGVGFLLDAEGDDTYDAWDASTKSANGGGELGVGALLDASGTDTYITRTRDSYTSCQDCSDVLKGSVGTQVDGPGIPVDPDYQIRFFEESDESDQCDEGTETADASNAGCVRVTISAGGVQESQDIALPVRLGNISGTAGCDSLLPPPGPGDTITCTAWADVDGDGERDVDETHDVTVPDIPDDLPVEDFSVSIPDQDHSFSVPEQSTPEVPGQDVDTPPIGTPPTCDENPCQEETVILPGQEESTPEITVPEQCTPFGTLCVGPLTISSQDIGTDPVTAPPVCNTAEEICLGPITLVPGQNETTPEVPSQQVTPPATVSVFVTNTTVEGHEIGATEPIEPTTVTVPGTPVTEPLPVTVCQEPSPVCQQPIAPSLTAQSDIVVHVQVGDEVHEVTAPIDIDQ